MAKFKITQDHEQCIACGNCATLCPANWRQSADGKYEPIKGEADVAGCNREAEKNCPVKIIHVKEA